MNNQVKITIDVENRNGWWTVIKNGIPTHETSQRQDWAQEKATKMAQRLSAKHKYSIRKIKEGCYDLY